MQIMYCLYKNCVKSLIYQLIRLIWEDIKYLLEINNNLLLIPKL